MVRKVTGEEVKASMIENGIETIELHPCSICGYMLKYLRRGENLFFDRGCDCVRRHTVEPCFFF